MARTPKVRYKVLEFIRNFKTEIDGISPTYAEISAHFGWASETTAWWHVDRLDREGLVRLDEQRRITLPRGEYIPPPEREVAVSGE